jgi:flagellar biosynthesis/type III secretory pathway M-ring protein FliF/YscJ
MKIMKEITKEENEKNKQNEQNEFEKPPIFGTWKVFYSVVVGELVLLIALFYLFGIYFSS